MKKGQEMPLGPQASTAHMHMEFKSAKIVQINISCIRDEYV